MRAANVYVLRGKQRILAGELRFDDRVTLREGGGSFRYARSWLADKQAFPLDPINLPLGETVWDFERQPGIPPAIEDALPDTWGRILLQRQARIPHGDTPALLLALQDGQGIAGPGALAFRAEAASSPAQKTELPQLLAAASDLLNNQDLQARELQRLVTAGSSIGGARPKAMIEAMNTHWIAKFPAPADTLPIVEIERCTMRLAKSLGLEVPQTLVTEVGQKKVLLVERFDIAADGGRHHLLSLWALSGGGPTGVYDYPHAADLIRRVSSQPKLDLERFFKQAVFNAAIGNTDDHDRNWSMLFDGKQWRLSPAYDLLPNIANRPEHVIAFTAGGIPAPPDFQDLLQLSRHCGLKPAAAEQILNTMRDGVAAALSDYASWPDLSTDIERRLKRMQPRPSTTN